MSAIARLCRIKVIGAAVSRKEQGRAQMENDVVRTSGDNTLVDLWLEGRSRSVTVSKSAVEAFLRVTREDAASMTPLHRREFVRTHLGLISKAATTHLQTNPTANMIVIGSGEILDREATLSGV